MRDKDLDLLLSITSDAQAETEETEDDTDELRWIVQRSIEHLGCPFGALVIPEKGIAICRAGQVRRRRRVPKYSRALIGTC